VVAPIIGIESRESIGGVHIARYQGDPGEVTNWVPAVQSLAAQISSTLHGARVYAQTLAQQRVAQELALAGQIQASFLPDALPDLPGWQLAAVLEPARETSGDFYDLIPLPNGQLGILVADVADKGMGAALYMALCRTLIRTYAAEHHTRPDRVLSATNRRILMDARADLFVAVFYGVLDPATGTLTYCNAGHNPPYLFHGLNPPGGHNPPGAQSGDTVQALRGTGMVLGVIEEATWRREVVQLAPGDVLLLYTDGITEAQNQQQAFFGEQRLLEVIQANTVTQVNAGTQANRPVAQDIQDALLAELRAFVGDAPQVDDITLMVIVRDS
jgi:sigma-B regulation protein RsbU (phosphoserine phosphatase)